MDILLQHDQTRMTGTPDEIVTQMRLSTRLCVPATNADYMQEVAQRVTLWNLRHVCTEDAETFLLSLEEAGVLTIQADTAQLAALTSMYALSM